MQEILNKHKIKIDYQTLLTMWNEPHRGYHNQNHLLDLIEQINLIRSDISQLTYEKLMLAAIFHDIIYDVTRTDNEEQSALFFLKACSDKNPDMLEIAQVIRDTQTHTNNTELSALFNKMDMSILERSYEDLVEYEKGIHKGYGMYGEMYKIGRLDFLTKMMDKYPLNSDNLMKLIDYVEKY